MKTRHSLAASVLHVERHGDEPLDTRTMAATMATPVSLTRRDRTSRDCGAHSAFNRAAP